MFLSPIFDSLAWRRFLCPSKIWDWLYVRTHDCLTPLNRTVIVVSVKRYVDRLFSKLEPVFTEKVNCSTKRAKLQWIVRSKSRTGVLLPRGYFYEWRTCLGKVLFPPAIDDSKIGTFVDCNYSGEFWWLSNTSGLHGFVGRNLMIEKFWTSNASWLEVIENYFQM